MSLDDLSKNVDRTYRDLGEELVVHLDAETRNELAILDAVLEPDETDDLVRRAIHLLFQNTVDTGRIDFHLRRGYDVTYDEYLMDMTYEQMSGGTVPPRDDERRYQF